MRLRESFWPDAVCIVMAQVFSAKGEMAGIIEAISKPLCELGGH